MRTLKQIADDLGLDKSTVFRYAKSAGIMPQDTNADGTAPRNGVQYYDATAETAIKQHFEKKSIATQRRNTVATDAIPENARATMLAMVQNLKRNIADLEKQHEADTERIAELAKQNADAILQCNDAHAAEVERIRAEHKEEVQRAQAHIDSLTAEKDKLREDHKAELDQLRADHKAELDRMQAAYKDEAQRMQDLISSLQAQLDIERQHSREQSDRLAQLADQAQRLQLAQMQPPAQIEQKPPNFWQRLFGKKPRGHDFDMEGGQDHSPD